MFFSVFSALLIIQTFHSSVVISRPNCGWSVTLTAGQSTTFESPKYPDNYDFGSLCRWRIESPPDTHLELECSNVDALLTNKCYDFLKLWEVDEYGIRNSFFSYCRHPAFTKILNTNSLLAKFAGDRNNIDETGYSYNDRFNGFSCNVIAVQNSDGSSESPTSTETTTTAATTAAATTTTTTTTTTQAQSSYSCGIKGEERIVNGKPTGVHEYPWQAVLMYKSSRSHYCGGSMIANQWVLTASHCVDIDGLRASSIIVGLGEHILDQTSDTNKTVDVNVIQIIMHPNYDSSTTDNDVALLKLERAVEYSTGISPICLPTSAVADLTGRTGTVTGWGTTSSGGSTTQELYEVDMPILTTSQCQSGAYNYGSWITNNMICTYEPGKDSCQGDSGGPLICEEAGRNYQVGVVSWGVGCAEEKHPGVYAKLSNYVGWISTKTGIDFTQ